MSKEELLAKKQELAKNLMKVNLERSRGTTPKNPREGHNIRKTIAKIMTILNELNSKEESKKQ